MTPKNRLQKNIFLLGLVSLLNDISSEIIAPLLPFIIKNLGGSGIAIGIIGGAREGLIHILKLAFGLLSDRSNSRKPFVFMGYLVSTLLKGALFFAQAWQHVLACVGLEGIGKGIRTSARDVIIAQSTPTTIARSFGLVRSFDNIGATIGALIVFALIWLYKLDTQIIIIIATTIALTSLIPLFFIEEPKQTISLETPAWGPVPLAVKKFAIINSIFHLGSISYMFLTLRVHDFSGIFSPMQNTLIMYMTFNIIHALCATPFGMIIDNFNKKNCVIIGYIAHGIVMLGFWVATTPIQFWILFMAYGISLALTDISQKTLAINLAPVHRQGTSIGVVYAAIGIAQITGSFLCGVVWEYSAHEYIFFIATITATTSALLLKNSSLTAHNHAQ